MILRIIFLTCFFFAGALACSHQSHKSKHAQEKVKADCSRYEKGSTMCLHAANCKRAISRGGLCGPVSEEEKELILREHNKYRQKVASGNETMGHKGPQPPGTNIFELEWSDELADFAERWSEQKVEKPHDCYIPCRQTKKYKYVGQNVYWYYNTNPIKGATWKKAIYKWYREVEDVDPKTFTSPNKKVIGHYTQLVWASTRQVGCAVFADNEHCSWKGPKFKNYYCQKYVCNYGPAGNFKNQPVYSQTEKCERYSEEYPNLCVK